MDPDEFSSLIEAARTRVGRLRRASSTSAEDRLGNALEELGSTLEELEVANEELRVQTEELADARQAAEAAAARYQELFEFAPAAYLVTNADAIIEQANGAAEVLFNRRRDFLIGKPLVLFLAEEDRATFHSCLTRLQSGSERHRRDWAVRFKPHDQTKLDVAMTVSAVHGPEGGLKGLRWLLENVTDRQSARRRLDTQHRITRILAESSTLEEAAPRILHGICENLDWEIGEIWQLDSQAGGLRCLNLWHVPSLDVSEFETTTRTLVLPKGVGLAGRVWEGGEPLWITDLTTGGNLARAPLAKRLGLLRAFGFPIRLGGEILGVILFFTRELRPIDTALLPMFAAIGSQIGQFIERRRAEGALRESEQTFRSIFHGSLDAVAINRLEDGLYVEVNEEFLLLTGYTRDQVIGRLPTEFDIWVDLPNLKTAIMDELRGKRIVRNLEVKFRKRDGTVRQALFSAVMMEIGDDPCILSFARDVTEQKKAEDSLRQLSTRLLNLQDEERRRIALELHDNTAQNLAGLTMNLARVGKSADKLDPKASEALGESLSLAEQCAREVRTVSYRLHPPLLDEMGLASALQLFTEGFSERSGLRVELDLRSDLDPVPPEIQRTLFRIAQEALSNVYRHSGSSTARIRMDRDASSVTLEVSDQGGGFPPGILDATSGTVADLGVGIAGMRERIRQLGGHLEITSTAEGSILTVNLPIVR